MITHDLFYNELVEESTKRPRQIKRAWLETRLLAALEQPGCDFVLISGEPGTGKSTFMLGLAGKYANWPRYFIRKDQVTPFGEPSPRAVLLQVGFQLAARFPKLFKPDILSVAIKQRIGVASAGSEIVGAEVDRLLASPFFRAVIDLDQQVQAAAGTVVGLRVGEWVTDPNLIPLADLQNMALFDPATALAQEKTAEPVVVLIDALDELRFRNGGMALLSWLAGLPEIPRNLHFVLTSRPDDVLLAEFRQRQAGRLVEIELNEDDPDLQQDVREYATILANEPAVRHALERSAGVGGFVEQAVARANSNLGYLDAVGRAVDQALQNKQPQLLDQILDMQKLPASLKALYGAFLGWLRSAVEAESVEVEDATSGEIHLIRAWTGVYYKILGLLAVAVAPMDISQLRRFGSILPETPVVRDALQRMSQFLDHLGDQYRLYHPALAEYLTDSGAQTEELAIDASAWHKRIAEVAWRAGAPAWQQVDEYVLNGLAMHLLGAGDRQRLQQLIAPAWMAARFNAGGHTYGGFQADLRSQRRIITSQNLRETAPELILNAILTTGLVALSDDLPPGLLLRLVTSGAWRPDRAMDTLARSANLFQAARAYLLLLEQAGLDPAQEQAARNGLQGVQTRLPDLEIPRSAIRVKFNFSQVSEKRQKAVAEALAQVLKVQRAEDESQDFGQPGPDWEKLYQALDAAFREGVGPLEGKAAFGQSLWSYLGVGLAFTLPQPRRERHRLLAAGLEWLSEVKEPPVILQADLLETALQLAQDMPLEQKGRTLSGLAILAPDEMIPGLLEATLAEAGEPEIRQVLDGLAARLDKAQALMVADTLRQSNRDPAEQAEMLLALLAVLREASRGDILLACLQRIEQISPVDADRSQSLQARYRLRVLPYLDGEAYQENLEQALAAIQGIPTRPNHTLVLKALEFAEWLPYLPADRATELALAALKLVDVDEPVFVQYVLPAVYPYLPSGFDQFGALRVAINDEADYRELIELTQSKEQHPPVDLVWRVLISSVGELSQILPPGRVLRLLAPHIPADHLEQAVQMALDLGQDPECGQALLVLLPRLEPALLKRLAAADWQAAAPALRWKIKGAAASRTETAAAPGLKAQAWAELENLEDPQAQAELLGALAEVQPGWVNEAAGRCLELCWKLLQPGEQESRAEFLHRGAALIPGLAILINEERLDAVAQALLRGLDWKWL